MSLSASDVWMQLDEKLRGAGFAFDDDLTDHEAALQSIGFLDDALVNKEMPHVVVFVEGGLVQEVIADQNVHYTIFDEDTDGGEGTEEIQPYPDSTGDPNPHLFRPFKAVITDLATGGDPARVKHYADQIPPE